MNNRQSIPLVQFSLFSIGVVVMVAAVFAAMMRIYGVERILPWAIMTGLILILFAIGRWMVENVKIAAANDPTAPRKLETFNTNMEAEVFVSRLGESGIRATAVGGFVSGFQAESPGYVDVVVANQDFQRAQAVVASWGDEIETPNVQPES